MNTGLFHLLYLIVVIAMGIGSRLVNLNTIILDKYLGDALYAAMIYLILRLFFPTKRLLSTAIISCLFMVLLEIFQLTGIPLNLRQSGNMLAYYLSILLGTTFAWLDLLSYVVGIASVFLIEEIYQLTSSLRKHKPS